MGDTEEYFPRGGKKPTVTYFKQSSNFLAGAEQGERKKKKQKKKPEGDDGYLSDEAHRDVEKARLCGAGISYQTAKEGLVILGRIRQVMETKLLVMMPGRMMGFAMACHISEPYNKLLEAYVNDQVEGVRELSSMFRPGQYVALKVLETKNRNLLVSLMPQHVNAGLTNRDLQNGCLLQAAVSSVEDHGYVMDTGVAGIRAFLPKKGANPEVALDVGSITWCCVKSSDAVVTLSSRLEDIQGAVVRRKPGVLLPGMGVDLHVDQALEDGIEGHIFKDTTAYVQRSHADTVKGKKPTLGQKVRAHVLYVMPTRHAPFLTMRGIFDSACPDLAAEQTYKEGDIVDNAQVVKISGRSVLFRLCRGSVGALSLHRLRQSDDLSDDELIASSYPLGSTHRVRVLCYNLCDYMYSVTDQSDVINEQYFSLDQFHVGDVVTGVINTVTDTNVTVTLGRVTGFVPQSHLCDAGMALDPKKTTISKLPRKKYKPGQEVSARVLAVDPSKNALILTLKPSLLAPDLEVLKSYDQAVVGKAYTGVIKFIRDYVLVAFFGGVQAYVSRQYVTRDTDTDIRQAFHLGQIVNCTILKVDPEAKKMNGSLVTPPFWQNKKHEPSQKRKQRESESDSVSNKKHKSDDDEETSEKLIKHKKDKKKTKEISESENETDDQKVKKKKKNKHNSEDQNKDIEVNEVTNKKEHKKKKKHDEETEIENTTEHKRKKNKKQEVSEESDAIDTDIVSNKKERKKKQKLEEETEIENTVERKRKNDKKQEVSEESDAIETDIQDDSDNMLAVQDLELLDLSECGTAKKCKRKVVSLIKASKARLKQLESLEKNIQSLEENGLDVRTKKQHTAFHIKKLVTEERLKKVWDTLKTAQDMLRAYGEEIGNKEYKKQKEARKQHVLDKKQKEKSQNTDENEPLDTADKKVVDKKVKTKSQDIKVVESLEPVLDVPSAKEFWSNDIEKVNSKVQEDGSSSSDEEEKEQPKKKRKKLSVAEKLAKAREEEERVREMERRAIESEAQPRSSDQFERALLANPDCSQLWIAYMAFHLQATEIDKARAVARKALTTISFRQEAERLNVWLALLNCEHRFGTQESQQKTLEEALQKNDTFQVHSKLLDILVDTGKQQELMTLADLMMRKYKRDIQAYMRAGDACYKLGMVDKARSVMQKGIAVLEKKEHVAILVHFALLERAHGARERAEALFEQVLAVYPQRVDICAVYADMLVKEGDVERVRQVMERLTSQKLPARKMKTLYKKWIEVEEKIGDKSHVETIKQRAMEFIEKAKF